MHNIKLQYHQLTPINILSGVMSYNGWMKYSDTRNLQSKYIDAEITQIVTNVCIQNNLHNPLGVA